MKINILPIALLLSWATISSVCGAEPTVIKLWPEGPLEKPGVIIDAEKVLQPKGESDVLRITNVSDPTISIYRPASPNGTAVMVCPGGGYGILAIEHEGTQVCDWLNGLGVTAVLLKYRVPVRQAVPGYEPLQDAQRAMSVLRTRSKEFGINPQRIGILGFSAGGHLASTISTHFEEDTKPNFSILIYPVISMDKNITHMGSRNNLIGSNPSDAMIKLYSNELQVTANTPPTFLIHASDDDAVPDENSLWYYQALKKNKVSAEMHIYPAGGHGFGLANGNKSLETWSNLLIEWMRGLNK